MQPKHSGYPTKQPGSFSSNQVGFNRITRNGGEFHSSFLESFCPKSERWGTHKDILRLVIPTAEMRRLARLTMEIVIGLLLSLRMCYNDACLCERGVVVFYTMEEAAVLCGFLELYLNRDSVDAAVRKNYEKFRLGLVQESLGRDDYIWVTKALSFLRPHWWQDHEDHRALENALLKTQTLALKTKK